MDFVFKGLFGNEKRPELLISFLNAVLTPDEPITSITFKDRVLDKQYKNDKLGSLDILATTNKGELINVEVQVADLDFNLLDSHEYHSCYVLKEKERNEVLSDLLELHFIELDKIKDIKQASDIKTHLEAWLEFIKHPESQVSYELARQDEAIREAKDDLLILSCNEQFRLYYEARLKALLDKTSRLQTAREEGLAQGIEQEKLKHLKNCFSLELSEEQIARITELSIDEVRRLRQELTF